MVSADILFPFAADLLLSEPVRCASRGLKQKSRSPAAVHKVARRPILVDVSETGTEIEILADLPGVAKSDIQLDVDEGSLILEVKPTEEIARPDAAARPTPGNAALKEGVPAAAEPPKKDGQGDAKPNAPGASARPDTKPEPKVHRKERSLQFAKRVLTLPETADLSRADATLANGVLRIVVAKKELPSPKRICIA